MPVAKTADVDRGISRHGGRAGEDGVSCQEDPGIRAETFHVTGDVEHQLDVVILVHPASAIEIAKAVDHLTTALHEVFVVRDRGRVDYEVCVLE